MSTTTTTASPADPDDDGLTDAERADFRVGGAAGDGPAPSNEMELAALLRELAQLRTLIRRLEAQVVPRNWSKGGGGAVVVKVTGNAAGNGKYTGRVCTGSSTAVASVSLAMPEGLTVPAADDALVLNIYETGASTHDLAANTYHIGVPCGVSAGKTVVVIQSFRNGPC